MPVSIEVDPDIARSVRFYLSMPGERMKVVAFLAAVNVSTLKRHIRDFDAALRRHGLPSLPRNPRGRPRLVAA